MKKLLRWLLTTRVVTADVGLLTFRVSLGLMLSLGHGVAKMRNLDAFIAHVDALKVPEPQVLAIAVALAEFLGGIFMALGLFTRGAALAVLVSMSAVLMRVHAGDPFAKQELALLYGLGALSLFIAGPGRVSFDHLLFGRQKGPAPLSTPPASETPPAPPEDAIQPLADLLEGEPEDSEADGKKAEPRP